MSTNHAGSTLAATLGRPCVPGRPDARRRAAARVRRREPALPRRPAPDGGPRRRRPARRRGRRPRRSCGWRRGSTTRCTTCTRPTTRSAPRAGRETALAPHLGRSPTCRGGRAPGPADDDPRPGARRPQRPWCSATPTSRSLAQPPEQYAAYAAAVRARVRARAGRRLPARSGRRPAAAARPARAVRYRARPAPLGGRGRANLSARAGRSSADAERSGSAAERVSDPPSASSVAVDAERARQRRRRVADVDADHHRHAERRRVGRAARSRPLAPVAAVGERARRRCRRTPSNQPDADELGEHAGRSGTDPRRRPPAPRCRPAPAGWSGVPTSAAEHRQVAADETPLAVPGDDRWRHRAGQQLDDVVAAPRAAAGSRSALLGLGRAERRHDVAVHADQAEPRRPAPGAARSGRRSRRPPSAGPRPADASRAGRPSAASRSRPRAATIAGDLGVATTPRRSRPHGRSSVPAR